MRKISKLSLFSMILISIFLILSIYSWVKEIISRASVFNIYFVGVCVQYIFLVCSYYVSIREFSIYVKLDAPFLKVGDVIGLDSGAKALVLEVPKVDGWRKWLKEKGIDWFYQDYFVIQYL